MTENWYYKVTIIVGTGYDDVRDPEFKFSEDEKAKMYEFIDTCLKNGHEINVVYTTEKYDK